MSGSVLSPDIAGTRDDLIPLLSIAFRIQPSSKSASHSALLVTCLVTDMLSNRKIARVSTSGNEFMTHRMYISLYEIITSGAITGI